jgi:hypothetical protein
MRGSLLVTIILAVTAGLAFSQNSQNAPSTSSPQSVIPGHRTTITGCLTGEPDHYRLTDEKGVTNIIYSTTVHLDSYVGRPVTLLGVQSATPSTDTGTARPMPHFKVLQVHLASGNCK